MNTERSVQPTTLAGLDDGSYEWVEDAAAPELDAWQGDVQMDPDFTPAPRAEDTVASPEDAARLRREAQAAAEKHVARVDRRRSRRPGASLAWHSMALAGARYCVIDLETTGSGATDEILEVGCVQLHGGEFGRELSQLVVPQGRISARAFEVHGIGAAALRDAPRIEAVLPLVLELGRDHVLVFHNAPFDSGFLQRALADAGLERLDQPVVDTVRVARALLGGRVGLGAAARRLGLDGPHAHRALADARLTAQLWLELLAVLDAAGATDLEHVPGAQGQPPRTRSRQAAAHATVARRLETARARTEALRVRLRMPGGAAALEVPIRVMRRERSAFRALDLDRNQEFLLDPTLVETIEPLR